MEVKKYDISLNDSFAIKGIALILLLIHHLFYVQHGYYADFDIAGYGVVQQIGIASKACVAVFVFLGTVWLRSIKIEIFLYGIFM